VKKILAGALAALTLAAIPPPALAAGGTYSEDTALELYQRCTSSDETRIDAAYCLGYVRATVVGAQYVLASMDRFICHPDASNGQFKEVFLSYYRRNADKRLDPAISVMALALYEKWPCAEGSK
jgi:hypothetical protein